MQLRLALPLLVVALAACGGDDGAAPGPDAGPTIDAATDAPPPVPLIGDVLTCGVSGSVGGMAAGTDLQRHDLDLSAFPDALCNDGTGAVFYYRPFSGDANRNRWAIELVGGGGCIDPQSCANRWCQVGTNFSKTQMTSSVAPRPGTIANGIFARRADNPLGNWNQVLVRYCSSDNHAGLSRDVVLAVDDPVSGAPRTFRMHFLGGRIFDAVIATLRADGVASPSYTLGGGATPMPDLDAAEQVVLAGASAGGGGTIRLVDGFATALRATNPGVQVVALIDSIFGPSREGLDFSRTAACLSTAHVCDYQTLMTRVAAFRPYTQRDEDSCTAWHQTNQPASAYKCTDVDHLIRHHLTTPMFVRMGQRDELISDAYVGNYSLPGAAGTMTLADFAALVRRDMNGLADLRTTAEEGARVVKLPGGFSPSCAKHETLRNTEHTFDVTIGAGQVPMFQAITAWTQNQAGGLLVTPLGGVEFCPPTSPP